MIGLIVLLFLYVSLFVIAEVVHKIGFAATTTRKFVHIGAGIVSCFLPVLTSQHMAIFLGLFFSILLFWTKRKGILDSIHRIENNDVGAVLFPLGLIPCALIFWNDILVFSSSALILGFSDGSACIFGRLYGKRGYSLTGYKTLEGSLAFFGATAIIFLLAIFFSHEAINLTKALLIIVGSLVVTIIEGMIGKGWDNLFIPVSAALVARLILAG